MYGITRPTREAIMTRLFSTLTASIELTLKADTQAGSGVLLNPSSMAGLFVGLPVSGGSIPRGATITSLEPLTVSQKAQQNVLQVSFSAGFATTGRRLKPWSQVQAQPALFLRGADEELEYPEDTILQFQTIKAEIWIYSKASENPNLAPETPLNNLLDAVQAAFAPDDPQQQRFTLAGLVHWCRLAGSVDKATGDLDGQSIAAVDVQILVP